MGTSVESNARLGGSSLTGNENDCRSQVVELIRANERWLMNRILSYARDRGFAQYTSTLEEAWRASISGLSEAIVSALEDPAQSHAEFSPHPQGDHSPVSAFAIEQARRYRQRGIDISMFLALMKYYKRSYLDLISSEMFEVCVCKQPTSQIHQIFDAMEVHFCSEWLRNSKPELVTELQQTNRELANEKNKYLTLFESISSPAIFVNTDGYIENLNFAASQITQVSLDSGSYFYNRDKTQELLVRSNHKLEMISENIGSAQVSLETLLPEHGERLQQLANSASIDCLELEFHTVEGTKIFQVHCRTLMDVSRKFDGHVFIFSEITGLRTAQHELEMANEELQLFNATVSHDLRAPLRQTESYFAYLQDAIAAKDEQQTDELMGRLIEINTNARTLVDGLLRLGRSTHAELSIKSLNLRSVATKAIRALEKKHPDVPTTSVEVTCDGEIRADGELLQIVLENLIGNACKYSRNAQFPHVEFGCEGNGDSRVFFVRDNGIGFDAEMAQHLFTPFRRLHSNNHFEGTGIGLTTCKNIIDRHGGRIWADSLPGAGAVFRFTLTGEAGG